MAKRKTPENETTPAPLPQRGRYASRAEQEQRLRRLVIGSVIGLAIVIVGLLTFGFVEAQLIIPNQVVAEINGESILYGDYAKRVRLRRAELISQFFQYEQFVQLFSGGDPNTEAFYRSQQNLVALQLNNEVSLGQETLNSMIEDTLIRQQAAEMGLSLDPDAVDRAFEERYGYYRDGTPTPAPTFTPFPTGTPLPTPEGATPEPTLEPTLAPTAGPSATPFPSPTPVTEQLFRQQSEDLADDLRSAADMSIADYKRLVLEPQLLRELVRDSLFTELLTTETEVRARHILVSDEAQAREILAEVQGGADFTALVTEFSIEPGSETSGGDLGFFGLGMMVPEFEKATFNAEIGIVQTVVQTDFGWHVIEVLERRERDLDEFELQTRRDELLVEWLLTRRDESTVALYPNVWSDQVPTDPAIPAQFSQN